MKFMWIVYALVIFISVVAAKKKKLDADFEFIDKVNFSIHLQSKLFSQGFLFIFG